MTKFDRKFYEGKNILFSGVPVGWMVDMGAFPYDFWDKLHLEAEVSDKISKSIF